MECWTAVRGHYSGIGTLLVLSVISKQFSSSSSQVFFKSLAAALTHFSWEGFFVAVSGIAIEIDDSLKCSSQTFHLLHLVFLF